MSAQIPPTTTLKRLFTQELKEDILPFWINHMVDGQNGGFYGALTNQLKVVNDVPRSAVLCARILWTYATAYRTFKDEQYLKMAQYAYQYLTQVFWDKEYGGVYWSVDAQGKPVSDRKHIYAQAFTIYGLAEYNRATGDAESLELARKLFRLVEDHTHDAVNGGNFDCRSREWKEIADMRLGGDEPIYSKCMNTMLHLMEAYTNLLRVWDDPELRSKQKGTILAFLSHIIDPQTNHFKMFFDDRWNSQNNRVSYGHDIEGSWLLVEAAEVQGDEELLEKARAISVKMAEVVLKEAFEPDGALISELDEKGEKNTRRTWWTQAEAVVGFYNAYQISGRVEFAEASYRVWIYIWGKFIDRVFGEWWKYLSPEGKPDLTIFKAGPWECPYHNARTCFEMLARLK